MHFSKLTVAAFAGLAVAQNSSVTLLQALNSTSNLSTLLSLVRNTSSTFQTTLTGLTGVTIFAPSNAAFSQITAPNTTQLLEAVLSYHVVTGTYQNFTNTTQFIPTALSASTPGNLTSLSPQVLEAINMNGNNTLYSGYKANSSAAPAIQFSGGYIHIIDHVLTIPPNAAQTLPQLNLTSLYGSVTRTNLTSALDTAQGITIFAPNNRAFQNIGSLFANGSVNASTLASILQYHVVGQVLYSTNLTNTSVPALAGGSLTVRVVNSSTVYVNNARVVNPNILLSNGVLHVIDEVLNPGNASATPNESAGAGSPAFSGASGSDQPPNTSGAPSPTISRGATGGANPTSTSSSKAGAWHIAPTGLPVAMLAGVMLAL